MGFLNPLLLYGLGFLAVPIIIQFFVNRRRVVLHWAAFDWMQRAVQRRRKRVRVNDLLKLLSKLLLVLLIVLFITRPVRILKGRNDALVIVDTTLSMATRIGDHSRLDRARELARTFIETVDGRMAVYTFDGRLAPVSNWQKSKTALVNLVNTIELSSSAGTARDLLNALLTSPGVEQADTIVFISDLQKTWYADRDDLQAFEDRLGKETTLLMVPVDRRTEIENCGLVSYETAPEGFFPGRENEIAVRVRNFSPAPAAGLPVTLIVDGRDVDRAIVDLGPGEEKTVVLAYRIEDTEPHDMVVSVPGDPYPLDDRLHIEIAPRNRINVLVVAPERGDRPFEADVFFSSALRSIGRADLWNIDRVSPSQAFNRDPANYDLVVLLGVNPTAENGLAGLVADQPPGRGLVLFNDCSADDAWRSLGIATGPVSDDAARVDRERLANTYLGFMAGSHLDPGKITFFRSRTIPADGEKTIGRLYVEGRDDPLVVRTQLGPGRPVVAAGFVPYLGYTDFYYNPNFIQFCLRLVWDVMEWELLVQRVGAEAEELALPRLDAENNYLLSGGDRGMRELSVVRDARGARLVGARPEAGGFYTILENNQARMRFGYDVTRADSDIEPAPAEAFENTALHFVADARFESARTKQEYRGLMLALLLGAMLLEHYAHFMRKR